jgi:hypothetical protein
VVPVPAVDRIIAEHVATGRRGTAPVLPAHVTVLSPFLEEGWCDDGTDRALRELFAGVAPFVFRLARIERFPDVVYLAPEPVEPFRALTRAVHHRWPDYPPYNGVYDDVIPHVTVAATPPPPGFEAALERVLPIEVRASEVLLVVARDEHRWEPLRRYPLGTAPSANEPSPPTASSGA